MITVEEYKSKLINAYRHKADDTLIKRKERKNNLERKYSPEAINKIINDTYEFARLLLNTPTIEDNYCSFPIEDPDIVKYISLGSIGGGFVDRLYLYENYVISERILEYIFGKNLFVEIKEEEIDFDTGDPDIISYDYNFYLYLQGFPKNIDEIKEELLSKNKQKKKSF